MKSILLTSTALVAFAGAAAAEGHTGVNFGGDAELGYNDDFDNGVFWSFGLSVSGVMELDNGLKATISGDVELINDAEIDDQGTEDPTDDVIINATSSSSFDGNDVQIDDLVIGLEGPNSSLKFGDTAPAADSLYSSAVTNVDADGFNDEDDLDGEDGILIGTATFGATTIGASYGVVTSNEAPDDDLVGLQIGANTTLGNIGLSFGYQEGVDGQGGQVGEADTDEAPEIFALSATTTFGGLDVGLAYAKASGTNEATGLGVDLTSIGVQASYTMNAITATVFYVSQDLGGSTGGVEWDDNYGIAVAYASGPLTVDALYHDGQDEDMQINVGYDLGNGLTVFGGYRDEGSADDDTYFYVGGDYDLGGGANLRMSYADQDAGSTTASDELGKSEDVKVGTTIAVSFTF